MSIQWSRQWMLAIFSVWWFSALATAQIGAPNNIQATDGNCNNVVVTWGSVTGSVRYFVHRGTSPDVAESTEIGMTTFGLLFNDTTATPGVLYHYWVRAQTASGIFGPFGTPDTGFRGAAPPSITGVSATFEATCGPTTITWNPEFTANSYQVFRNTANSTLGATSVGTTSNTTINDNAGVAGVTYFYFVRGSSDCGTGAFSNSAIGRRPLTPGTPSNLSATSLTNCDGVMLTWNAAVNADTYDILRGPTIQPSDATVVANTGAPVTSFLDTTAVVQVTYFYFVRGRNGSCVGGISNTSAGQRGVAPATVSGLSASFDTSCASVNLAWSTVFGVNQYRVYRSTSNDAATSTQIGTSNLPQFADAMAVPGTTYFYWVRADNGNCLGPFGSTVQGRRRASFPSPTGVSAASGPNCNQITVTWAGVQGATGYNVLRSLNVDGSNPTLIAQPVGTSFTDTNLFAQGQQATYFVQARDATCTSLSAGPAVATTPIAVLITQSPMPVTVDPGQPAAFTVSVTGTQPITYQWQKDNVSIGNTSNRTGTNSQTMSILSASIEDRGNYRVRVTNACGDQFSAQATLGVVCKADFDNSNAVTVDDIFAFLSAWFAQDTSADVNESGSITVDDIFFFLSLWFTGC